MQLFIYKYAKTNERKQQKSDGDDNAADNFTWKVRYLSHYHSPSTLTECEHFASMLQTQSPPLLVLLKSCTMSVSVGEVSVKM